MSAPTDRRPTAILIRSDEQAAGRPWYKRRRNVALLLLGALIPGSALAAAIFFWGNITGQSSVANVSQVMKVISASGDVGPEGVSCVGSNAGPDGKTVNLTLATESVTVDIGTAGGATAPSGEGRQVQTGTCKVLVKVLNDGPRNVKVGGVITNQPAGWTITPATVEIPKNSTADMTINVTATDAVAGNADGSPTPFAGKLNLELLPNGQQAA